MLLNLLLRVPHSLRGWQRVRVLNGGFEKPTGAPVWARPSAFHHVQLLPAPPAAGNSQEARRFLEDSRRSQDPLPVLAAWLRGDVGAHSSAGKPFLCQDKQAVEGTNLSEAKGSARIPPKGNNGVSRRYVAGEPATHKEGEKRKHGHASGEQASSAKKQPCSG